MDTIQLAAFEFDTNKVEKSLEGLQNLLFDIQKEQKRYSANNKILQKDYDDITKKQKELLKAGQGESQAYKDLATQLAKVDEQQRGVFQNQKDLAIQQSVVKKEYEETVKVQKILLNSTGALLTSEEALTAALGREVNTRAEAKKSSIELNKLKDQLNPKIKEEAELLDQLNERVNANNQLLKETGSEREKQISNVGNYKNSIVEAANELNIFNGGLVGFVTRSQAAGGAGNLLKTSFGAISQGIIGMTRASLAFIATPIGAIIAVLGLVLAPLIKYLTSTQEGIDKITAVTRPLQSIFASLTGVVQKIGKVLFEAFSNPKKLLTDLVDFVKNNVINRFKAFGVVLEGLANFDLKKVTNGILQGVTGVENLTDKVVAAGKQTSAFLGEAIKKGQEIDRIQKLLDKGLAGYTTKLSEQNLIFEEQKKRSDDVNLTFKQREEATLKSIASQEQIRKLTVDRLNLEKQLLLIKQSQNDTGDAEKAEAAQKVADINKAIAEEFAKTTEGQNKLNAIRKEGADKAIAAQKAVQDAAIKGNEERLALFIAQQGFRSKTLEEQLVIDKQAADKSIAILKQELAAKSISRTAYNTEILLIQQDLLKKQAEVAIANAQLELDEYTKAQQEKLNTTDRLTSESVSLQKLALLDIRTAEETFQLERFTSGIINETAYQAELLRIKEESLVSSSALDTKYAIQANEDRTTARALEFESNLIKSEEEGALKFEADQLRADFQYQIKLQQQREAGLISEANYNKARGNMETQYAATSKAIETEKANFTLQAASQTFGNLAALAGKESAAGKAFAIAQTTIDTYTSAVAAYKSLAGIPVVGPALGGVAAGVAVASGLASVQKIVSTKTPKIGNPGIQGLATGGLVTGGLAITRSNGDDRLITAKTGEVILNEAQQKIIGADMFNIAGVPGFANGGVNGSTLASVQRTVSAGLDAGDLAATLGAAVEAGANAGANKGTSRGAQRGISDLSNNRQIQQNATF